MTKVVTTAELVSEFANNNMSFDCELGWVYRIIGNGLGGWAVCDFKKGNHVRDEKFRRVWRNLPVRTEAFVPEIAEDDDG